MATHGKQIKTFIILFIFSLFSLHLSAQDKYKVVLPAGGEWEIDGDKTEFEPGEEVKLKYVGSKKLARVELTAQPTKITISSENLTLGVGKTSTLIPEIYPAFENVDKRVTWESSNTSVATVDESGKVTAVAPGTATITVKTVENNKSAEIAVTVVPVPSFSVSETKKVVFSSGNLQYNTSTHKFQFAASQTEYKGTDQTTIKDLFGWGMWLDGTAETNIIKTSTNNSDYAPALDANSNFANNKTTVNGTEWFTLSHADWQYLFLIRDNHVNLYGWGSIKDGDKTIYGLILLPDDWTFSEDCPFEKGMGATTNSYTAGTDGNWSKMEAAGAVFLPAAGYRDGTSVSYAGSYGYYWSGKARGTSDAYLVSFHSGELYSANNGERYYGHSVRLVREVE